MEPIKHSGATADSHSISKREYSSLLSLPRTAIRQVHSSSWPFSSTKLDSKYNGYHIAAVEALGGNIHEQWV